MPENISAQGGQSQITQFETIAERGKETLDLSKVNELNYYESILEHTIRVTATIADTGYRSQKKSGNAVATRSVPEMQGANKNLAGYFFYETSEGYKFKSIDKLFEQKPKRVLIFNNIIGSIPAGYDGKIIDYSFDKTFNLKQLRQTGALGQTQLRTFNLLNNKYEESEFNYKKQFQGTNTAGTKPINYGEDQDETTRRFFSVKDFGVMPSGSTKDQIQKSKNTLNFNVDDILRQSTMRYNSLYTIKLSIVIAGDISLHAGDLIHCDFPEVSGEKLKLVDSEKSGIYMIHDLCHRITKNGCYTRLNLVRDSIGRKPIK